MFNCCSGRFVTLTFQKAMMASAAFFVGVVYIATVRGQAPTTNCPDYVDDGSQLDCTCLSPPGVLPESLTWPGHSDTSQLVIGNVRRQDNGTQYVCQMVVNGQTTTTTYTLQVAYGPSDNTLEISGQSQFPTDGSRSLTLTCRDRDSYPTPSYTWSAVTCDNGETGSTCTFTPRVPADDGKIVRCNAVSTDGSGFRSASKTFTVSLQYPTSQSPTISGYQDGQILKAGDEISCTVTGGKPPVESVRFSCATPTHTDTPDVVVSSSVTSSLTIDTSQASEDNMTCSCTAKWAPDTTLYTHNTQVSIALEYRATVKSYTINGTSGSLTVNERDNVTAIFTCNARGRPAPSVTLHKANGELLNEVGNTPSDEHDKTVSSTLVGVTSEDMGAYTCTADNNFTSPEQDKVQLNVRSAPKGNSTTSIANPELLTKAGLSFTVVAFPEPNIFSFTFYGSKTNPTLSSVPSGTFKVTSIREDPSLPVVICSIKPLNVPEDRLGVYDVDVRNRLEGSYVYYFEVTETVSPSIPEPFPYWIIIVVIVLLALVGVSTGVSLYYFKGKGKIMPWCDKKTTAIDLEKSPSGNNFRASANANLYEDTEIVPKPPGRLPPLQATPGSPDGPASPKKTKKAKSPKKKNTKREMGPDGDVYTLVDKGNKGDNTSPSKKKKKKKKATADTALASVSHGSNFAVSSNYSDVEPYASASVSPGHGTAGVPADNRASMDSAGYATVADPGGQSSGKSPGTKRKKSQQKPKQNKTTPPEGTGDMYDNLDRDGHRAHKKPEGPGNLYSHIQVT